MRQTHYQPNLFHSLITCICMDLGYSWPALGRELDMQYGSLSKELFMDSSMSQIKLRLRKVKQIIQDHMIRGKAECCGG